MVRKRKRGKKRDKGKDDEDMQNKLIANIDIKDAEKLLAQAKAALVDDHSIRALNFTEAAQKAARGTVWRYERALNSMNNAQEVINVSSRGGIEIGEAWNLLTLAKNAWDNKEYDKAFVIAERAKFACKPEPIIGKDIKILTAIGFEEGLITYKIRIENKMDYPIEKISLKPFLEGLFDSDAETRIMSNIAPQQQDDVSFVLMPTTSYQEVVTSGDIMLGRDMKIQTITTYQNGNFLYKVRLENNMEISIEGIKVSPFIPKGFISEIEEENVELLQPHESRTIIFKLIPDSVMEPVTEVKEEEPPPLDWQAIQPKEGTMTQIQGDKPIEIKPEFQSVTKKIEAPVIKDDVSEQTNIDIELDSLITEPPIISSDDDFPPITLNEKKTVIEKVQEKLEKTEEIPPPPIHEEKEPELDDINNPDLVEIKEPTISDDITKEDELEESLGDVDEDMKEEEWGSDWNLFKSLDERRKKILEDDEKIK